MNGNGSNIALRLLSVLLTLALVFAFSVPLRAPSSRS